MTTSLHAQHRESPSPIATDGESESRPFVSRGGIKLANALAASRLAVKNRVAIDVGASTGGFTDCLLRAGARAVICVDVGYGQLDWGLRNDPRVHVLERQNARALVPELLPAVPDLAVIDVAFISLAKVLPAVVACLSEPHDVLALIKPQFEVGRGRVGKGGVVRSPELRQLALTSVAAAAVALGEAVIEFYPSGLAGPKGNRETFIWLAEAGRSGATQDANRLAAMVAAADPGLDDAHAWSSA